MTGTINVQFTHKSVPVIFESLCITKSSKQKNIFIITTGIYSQYWYYLFSADLQRMGVVNINLPASSSSFMKLTGLLPA
jgi:hypothetical protein